MSAHSATKLKKCVVIVNPASTHYKRSLVFIEELRDIFEGDNFETVETSEKDYRNNQRLIKILAEKLDENTVLCIAGGDGTISLLINLLLTAPEMPANSRQAVILPLWGGNANDLAFMANGAVAKANIKHIVQKGVIAAAYPLSVNLQSSDKTYDHLAVGYLSFGASAYASELINRPGHRYKRIYRLSGVRIIFEAACVLRALVVTKTFSCEFNGVNRKLYDLFLINGSRIAKIYKVPDLKITDKYFYEVRIHRKHPVIISYIYKILRGLTFSQLTRTKLSLIVHEATWSQIDGEVRRIKSHTTVKVQPYEKPFYILSTKLKS